MSSSWIPSFPFSFSVPTPFSSTSKAQSVVSGSESQPTSPPLASTSRPHRFPSPPPRGTDTSTALEGSPNGNKRTRNPVVAEEEMSNDEPDRKRRKRGIVGTVLGTAIDAAVFSTALGYSAYQLWKHPPTKDDVDALAQRKRLLLSDTPHTISTESSEAPPPYSELVAAQSQDSISGPSAIPRQTPVPDSPSQIPRRVRHAHEPRPRLNARSSTSSPSRSKPLSSTVDIPLSPETLNSPTRWLPHNPLADLSRAEFPEFQPYSSPKFNSQTQFDGLDDDEEEEFEEDEEMKAVSDRLKSLIETGREALASRPREWSQDTLASSSGTSRSRLSTASSATTVSASPRKPSPLSQFTSRFDSPTLIPLHSASPRQSLPVTASPSHSPSHSRRRSLDTFSRIPTSTPALYAPSSPLIDPASLKATRKHRHTQSYGGISASQSLGSLNEQGEGVVDEFEKVLQQARKSRASTGGR